MGESAIKIRKAVIPAAGQGTRLLPLTRTQPKETLPIGRKPVIQHVVEEIRSVGIKHILIITTRDKKPIEDHFRNNESLLDGISYVYQKIGPDMPYRISRGFRWVRSIYSLSG